MNKTINDKRLTIDKYEPVIGLEVHVELNTKSKMFCRCSADYFGKEPNSQTCPICLGFPGSLPYINKEAIEKCIKIGLALGCKINNKSLFERKNYFYPDLPKGYQISQYRWPLCVGGSIEVEDAKGNVSKIRINRVHQEEDTAKLVHQFGTQNSKLKTQNEDTLIDFNRSGVPLVEIVTEPDFTDSSQIKDYAKKLQQIFRYLGVSNADMEKGDMRLEANISIRKVPSHLTSGNSELPNYRVELKNINSFRFMAQAVEYEIKRQIKELKEGRILRQETRGWDEDKQATYTQRVKEEANDYRYFPDPDLPEIRIKQFESRIMEIRKQIPELPWQKVKRYVSSFAIKVSDAKILAEELMLAEFFEKAVEYGKKHKVSPQQIANYMINQTLNLVDSTPQQEVDEIIGKSANVLDDEGEIEKIASVVIEENPKMVETYRGGKLNIIQALIGQVMRKTKGRANPTKVKQTLEAKLS